jgi:hypothetical protein
MTQSPAAGFAALLATALINAIRYQFSTQWSLADVIRFVGQARVRFDTYDLSPTMAEQILLAALRNVPLSPKFDEDIKSCAQITLLAALTDSLHEQQVDALLQEAREQANRWLARNDQLTGGGTPVPG